MKGGELMENVDLDKATTNILIELGGKVYLVGMTQDKLDAVNFLIKTSAEVIIPTGKSQNQLLTFLGR